VVKTILVVRKMVTTTLQARNFIDPSSEALDFEAFLISAIRAKIFLTVHP
jgi:hypothetical protein